MGFLEIFLAVIIIALPALSLSSEHKCELARTYYKRALEVKYEDTHGLVQKEILYRKAVELCPTFAEAVNNLGDVYEKQGRFEEALSWYEKAMRLSPNAPYPYFGIGDVHFKTGRYKEAYEWYKKGLQFAPHDELTKERMLQIGQIINDIEKTGVIKEATIKRVLSRGPAKIASLTFGEALIPFDFDRYDIRDDARRQLDELGKALSSFFFSKDIGLEVSSHPVFEIHGHTDIRGRDSYNLRLSEKRAESVKEYLVSHFKIPAHTLKAFGFGERRPICTIGASEEKETPCNALNRRVEIVRKAAGSQILRAKVGRFELEGSLSQA